MEYIISDGIKACVDSLMEVGRAHMEPAEAHKIFRECERLMDTAESVKILESVQWEPIDNEDDEDDYGQEDEEDDSEREAVFPDHAGFGF